MLLGCLDYSLEIQESGLEVPVLAQDLETVMVHCSLSFM